MNYKNPWKKKIFELEKTYMMKYPPSNKTEEELNGLDLEKLQYEQLNALNEIQDYMDMVRAGARMFAHKEISEEEIQIGMDGILERIKPSFETYYMIMAKIGQHSMLGCQNQ